MRSPFENMPPVVKNLLIINIILFLPVLFWGNDVIEKFGVFYFDSPLFKPWQLITQMFLHGGWLHIMFNMFALYSFGTAMEYIMGSKRFFNFYFISRLKFYIKSRISFFIPLAFKLFAAAEKSLSVFAPNLLMRI